MIDYGILNASVHHYDELGYKRIESPWLVSEKINDITCPPTAKKYYVYKGDRMKTFVASGEQSFLYLINKNFIPFGSYQTVTPCMRDDDFDDLHSKYFMKNELIVYRDNLKVSDIHPVVEHAYDFFRYYFPKENLIKQQISVNEVDINLVHKDRVIELGSYGFRTCYFCSWIYGTGVAEPRLSDAIKFWRNP